MSLVASLNRPVEILVAGFFLFVLLISIVSSTTWGNSRLAYFGKWSRFIPRWNFFAPHPGTHDYHILYREQFSSGSFSNWTEVRVDNFSSAVYPPFWNPYKLQKKAFFDIVQALAIETSNTDIEDERLKLTIPYLLILNKVSNADHSDFCDNVQFMIMNENNVDDDVEPIFVSGLHAV